MKKLKLLFASSALLLISAKNVLAQSAVGNVEEIPSMTETTNSIMVVFGLVIIAYAFFWIWMLVDAIKKQKDNKLMWVLLIIILPFLGSLIYFFGGKLARKN